MANAKIGIPYGQALRHVHSYGPHFEHRLRPVSPRQSSHLSYVPSRGRVTTRGADGRGDAAVKRTMNETRQAFDEVYGDSVKED